jgi:hypothetical protein
MRTRDFETPETNRRIDLINDILHETQLSKRLEIIKIYENSTMKMKTIRKILCRFGWHFPKMDVTFDRSKSYRMIQCQSCKTMMKTYDKN